MSGSPLVTLLWPKIITEYSLKLFGRGSLAMSRIV